MWWFIIYHSKSPGVTFCLPWPSLSVCSRAIYWLQFLVTTGPGMVNMQTTHRRSEDSSLLEERGKKTQIYSKWNSLSRHRSDSELIFLCLLLGSLRWHWYSYIAAGSVNVKVLFKSLLNGAQTPSATPAVRMIARPVWNENYKSDTPGISALSAFVNPPQSSEQLQPNQGCLYLSLFLQMFVPCIEAK